MLLPDVTDSAGTVRHLVVGAGKDGNIYVVNRDSMGKFNSSDNSQIWQQLHGALPNGIWSTPAYFNGVVEIPGWAGAPQPRADGSHEQVWHCVPFSEGAQYGIELFYPYDNELHVSAQRTADCCSKVIGATRPESGLQWPPFRTFGEGFLYLSAPARPEGCEGFAIRTEPHPRFYTDRSDTVPIAVPALIRNWWPMLFFASSRHRRRGACTFSVPASLSRKL